MQKYRKSKWDSPMELRGFCGADFNSQIKESMREVFVETIAFDLAKAVSEWEKRK